MPPKLSEVWITQASPPTGTPFLVHPHVDTLSETKTFQTSRLPPLRFSLAWITSLASYIIHPNSSHKGPPMPQLRFLQLWTSTTMIMGIILLLRFLIITPKRKQHQWQTETRTTLDNFLQLPPILLYQRLHFLRGSTTILLMDSTLLNLLLPLPKTRTQGQNRCPSLLIC